MFVRFHYSVLLLHRAGKRARGDHGTPEYVVNPSVSFDRTFDRLTWFTNIGYSWRSEFYGSPDSSELAKVDSYGILNARVGVRGELRNADWWHTA